MNQNNPTEITPLATSTSSPNEQSLENSASQNAHAHPKLPKNAYIPDALKLKHLLSSEELLAINKQIPMTQSLFHTILHKIEGMDVEGFFYDFLSEYQEFLFSEPDENFENEEWSEDSLVADAQSRWTKMWTGIEEDLEF